MTFRKMRLIPDEQFQLGGALEDEPETKRMKDFDNENEARTNELVNPVNQTTIVPVRQLLPVDSSPNKPIKQKRIERDGEKIIRLIKIALKIARTDSYDEQLRIKDRNGKHIEGSNLPELLKYVLSSQKIIIGENEFIHILNDAGIDPDWITNENVRARLLSLKNNKRKREPTPPPVERIIKVPQRTFSTIRDQFKKKDKPENTPLPEDDDDLL